MLLSRATARLSLRATFSATASPRALSTLVVGEHDGKAVGEATLAAITAVQALGPVELFLGGEGSKAAAEGAATIAGVSTVTYAESASLSKGLAEEWTPVVLAAQAAGSHTHIAAAASAFSKGMLPRVAALLDVAQLSDVLEVKGENTFVRPMYAGNAIATVESSDAVKVLTVRPTAFEKAAREGGSAEVKAASVEVSAVGSSEWVSEEVKKSDRPELATAKVVVSGGRGLKTGENFAMLDSLALKLDAAVGASRAAVDSGMCANDMQVGQTGKVVAPDLYIAIGISGAIQHLAGMKDSKTIVAINKDPEAPIFQVADYGLVADLFEATPELESKL
jgi:electron transfer flavoprotein alpha subunit